MVVERALAACRAWRDEQSHAVHLGELLDAGALSLERVRRAAGLGHGAARLTQVAPRHVFGDHKLRVLEGLRPLGPERAFCAAAAAYERVSGVGGLVGDTSAWVQRVDALVSRRATGDTTLSVTDTATISLELDEEYHRLDMGLERAGHGGIHARTMWVCACARDLMRCLSALIEPDRDGGLDVHSSGALVFLWAGMAASDYVAEVSWQRDLICSLLLLPEQPN